jgi:adenosylhomocysteine nucleosidase
VNDAIVIVAALSGEIKPLVRSWAALETRDGVDGWQHPSASIMAFCGGMGAGPATRAFARARQVCEPVQLLSVGWGGALREELGPGAIIRASMVRDLNTGEMFAALGTGGLLLTSTRVAVREDKERLARTYDGAVAVDMEAATLARLALAHGLGFRAIKAISDTLDEELPDMNPFITSQGQFATARFIAHVATKPRYWSALSEFGKQAKLAAENLCAAIADEIGVDRPI